MPLSPDFREGSSEQIREGAQNENMPLGVFLFKSLSANGFPDTRLQQIKMKSAWVRGAPEHFSFVIIAIKWIL